MLQPTVVPASTKLLLNGVACRAQRGLATAVDQNGGIGLFLFLFAKAGTPVPFLSPYHWLTSFSLSPGCGDMCV